MSSVEETFKLLHAKYRTPIVAEVGGFRPPSDPRCSWLCAGCKLPDEPVPQDEGQDMFPVLQINCEELPQHVEAFGDAKLVVVYFSNTRMPFNQPHGTGWLIREYERLDGLQSFNASIPEKIKPMPIRWGLGVPEPPCWEQSWELLDMTPINESEEATDMFFDLPHHGYTKIGGFPTEVQHIVDYPDDFVFQIGSEPKANLNWIDAGVAYFSKNSSGVWQFDIQFC